MTYCPVYCLGCQDFCKTNQLRVQALNIYHFNSFLIVIEDFKSEHSLTSNSTDFFAKTNDYFYMIKILFYPKTLNLYVVTITSHSISLTFR